MPDRRKLCPHVSPYLKNNTILRNFGVKSIFAYSKPASGRFRKPEVDKMLFIRSRDTRQTDGKCSLYALSVLRKSPIRSTRRNRLKSRRSGTLRPSEFLNSKTLSGASGSRESIHVCAGIAGCGGFPQRESKQPADRSFQCRNKSRDLRCAWRSGIICRIPPDSQNRIYLQFADAGVFAAIPFAGPVSRGFHTTRKQAEYE